MDTEELAELIIRMGGEINEVADSLYGAVKREPAAAELTALLKRSRTLLSKYDDLAKQLEGGKKRRLLVYDGDIAQIRTYMNKLEAR